MKNFDYASPTTEAEVLEHLREWPGETELIAGGTDLVGLMQKMVITPQRVVNLLDVPSFRDVEELDGGVVSIGATVTLDIMLVQLKAGTGNLSSPQMSPKDEKTARIAEREKFVALLNANFEAQQAAIGLLRAAGDLEAWISAATQTQAAPAVQALPAAPPKP